jgi:hypothetical protein
VISFGGKEVQTSGHAECGAEACIFRNEIGQMLEIDIEADEPKSFGSASSGTLQTYGHMVIIEFLGITLESIVYFAKFMPSSGLCRVTFQPIRHPLILPTTSSRNQFENSNSQYESHSICRR